MITFWAIVAALSAYMGGRIHGREAVLREITTWETHLSVTESTPIGDAVAKELGVSE